ncbi:DUF4446 family protein [uncultured Veillonella sp.]|uniref:DUF4446 family protein n=1 Tax=uncultured Veillonella sp. TaxID=159268 RepID=UPI0025F260CA|nr:DUF4446 family protein [uncultured Veillonella sp.]
MLENFQTWIVLGEGLVIIVLFLYCLVLQSKIGSLHKKYDYFMRDENGSSLERKLSVEVKELREAAESIETLFQQQQAIQNTQQSTFQKIGFVKYNAFENIGNDLSFSVTLLDGNNNGICISSVYGRSESRIFSKPIVKGKSLASLSQEEMESLQEALGTKSNEEALISASVTK